MANDYRFVSGKGPDSSGPYSQYNVMIATPTGHRPAPAYTLALAATAQMLGRLGMAFYLNLKEGNCHVDDVRNELFRDFLESDCTDLFFIDDDVGWRPQSFLRLVTVPGDIVAGIYPHRSEGETYPFHPGKGEREANEDGLFSMHKVPTGFMRIRRHVIEALFEREKGRGRVMWRKNEPPMRRPMARIVERGYVSELNLGPDADPGTPSDYHSGDYVLCLKARSLGFKVFADIEMEFEHVGEKAYQGHLGNFLRRQQGVDHPAFIDAVHAIRDGDVNDRHFETLNALSPSPVFALPCALLKRCWREAMGARGDVLELGSGLSTIVMAYALRNSGFKLYSLEHDLEWLKLTARWIDDYKLENVELIYAPLYPFENGNWYGFNLEALPETFDIALIDGPPRKDAKRSIAFDVIGDRLASASTWLIDDVSDGDESMIVKKFAAGRDVEIVAGVTGMTRHIMAVARKREVKLEAAE